MVCGDSCVTVPDFNVSQTPTFEAIAPRRPLYFDGCSGGSLVAIALALGIEREKRRELMSDFRGLSLLVRCPNIGLFFDKFGIEDGRLFREKIASVLLAGGLSSSSTMGDLRRLLRIEFTCVATEMNSGRPYYMNAQLTPEMLVADAIYASCCVPLLFTPHHASETCTLVSLKIVCFSVSVSFLISSRFILNILTNVSKLLY